MRAEWITIPALANDYHTLADNTVISVLDTHGVLEISGPDSSKFLQGQLTCNLQDITNEQSRPGAHCTHKGRMVASFRLLQRDIQHYLFCLPTETLPALQKALAKYIVFSKAKLRDASGDYLQLGISGPQAGAQVARVFGAAPAQRHAQHCHDNGIVICINEQAPRFLCLVPAERAAPVWQQLTADNNTLTDQHYWHWLDIRDGFGEVRALTIEEFIPQMLNLQLLDGISFSKGCYTGQEIVARMQYRGILKKAMYRIGGEGAMPAPNDALLQPGHEQAVGHIVMAEMTGTSHWEALAVIQHDVTTQALHTGSGHTASILSLPYNVTATEQQ